MSDNYNPAEHLRTLTRRRKVKENGQERWVVEEHQYLDVKWRIYWFRQVYPEGYIETNELMVTDQLARIEAAIYDTDPTAGGKCLAKARRQVLASTFNDYTEKAETQAIGRALALAGFGTQFCDELEEDDTVSDSPISAKGSSRKSSNAQVTPLHEQIYPVAKNKGLSEEDTRLFLYFKYRKDNPADLTTDEVNEFINGVKATSKEKLIAFASKLRGEQDKVA